MFVIATVGGALVVGALLGLRFKVLAIIPVILIAASAIIATGDSLKAIALTIFATAVLLQVGYALGLVCQGIGCSASVVKKYTARTILKV